MSVSGGSLGDRSKGCEYEKTGNRLRKQDERFTLVYRRFTQKKGTDFFPRTPRKKELLAVPSPQQTRFLHHPSHFHARPGLDGKRPFVEVGGEHLDAP